MTDELQTASIDEGVIANDDHVENNEITQEVADTAEGGAELATAQEETPAKIDDGVQKAINKQHAKYREEERKRIEIEKKLEDANNKLEKFEAEKKEVIIPDMPESWDEDFETKQAAREDAIKRQATQEAQNNVALEQQNAQKEAAQKAEQERFGNLVNDYTAKIVPLGLSPEEIRVAGEKVVEYGISGDVAEFILKQEDGPLITKYLADNPIVLDDLRNLPPIDAAFKINSEIKAAASLLKPQASTAPDPAETLTGRGAGEQVSPLIKGVTFT